MRTRREGRPRPDVCRNRPSPGLSVRICLQADPHPSRPRALGLGPSNPRTCQDRIPGEPTSPLRQEPAAATGPGRNDMMNSARLIDLVYARDPLWNPKSSFYHNREMKHLLWTEIAAELGVSRETVRTKWSCLRDSFRRELKKRNDSGLFTKAQWPFFSRMLFLTSAMNSKDGGQDQEYYGDNGDAFEMIANPEILLSSATASEATEEMPSTSEPADVVVKQEEPSTSTPATTYHPPPIMSMMSDFTETRYPATTPLHQQLDSVAKERSKLKKIRKKMKKDKKRDEDYHFALSLVSSMRRVPEHQKFKMRMMLMDTINTFVSHLPDNPDQSTCDNSTINDAESYTETDLSRSQHDGTQGMFAIEKKDH